MHILNRNWLNLSATHADLFKKFRSDFNHLNYFVHIDCRFGINISILQNEVIIVLNLLTFKRAKAAGTLKYVSSGLYILQMSISITHNIT